MTKPIEWTTTRKEDVPQRRHLEVCVCEERDQPRPGGWQKVDQQWATPSDIVAALAAMGEGERAALIGYCNESAFRNEATARAEKAERERDEARLDLDRAQAALAVVRHDLEGTRRDLGDLRARLIAAETAAAQREPREYPLAPGSRWDGDEIVDLDGTRTSAVGCTGGAHIWCVGPWGEKRFPRLADVLALAHRRGLL